MNNESPQVFNPITGGPVPIAIDVRICFGIAWYATEAEAETAGTLSRAQGNTYVGGYFDGAPCGRDGSWDRTDPVTGDRQYAATF